MLDEAREAGMTGVRCILLRLAVPFGAMSEPRSDCAWCVWCRQQVCGRGQA